VPPRRILIVYGTRYGQTARIAEHIRRRLVGRGFDVTLARGDGLPVGFTPEGYDGVVIGASLISHRHQQYVEQFVRRHRATLNSTPSAFFSVSGSAASPFDQERAEARRLLDAFLAATQWTPTMTATIGGAIAYTRYHPLLRWWMKRVSKREGGPTDTSRDHELTDWTAVDAFTDAFAAAVPAAEPAPPGPAAVPAPPR
jgi:menaquinone-dependent protoporphyrinogen oxidase